MKIRVHAAKKAVKTTIRIQIMKVTAGPYFKIHIDGYKKNKCKNCITRIDCETCLFGCAGKQYEIIN